MANYTWHGRNGRGEVVKGQLDAMSEGAVVEQLTALGVVPVHITISVAATGNWLVRANNWLVLATRKGVEVDDLLIFWRQMHALDKAGVPLLRSLEGLEASVENPAMEDMIKDIRFSLEQGLPLSAAMARHTNAFGEFNVSMVKTGEMTGRLDEIFLRLHEYMVFNRDVRERIKQALRYPVFVLIAMAIAIAITTIFVIPIFAGVYEGYDAELPPLTRGLLDFSSWMVSWWPLMLAAGIAAGAGIRGYLRTPAGRYLWDASKIKLPIIGSMILKATLARFAHSLALSSQSGVPLVQAIAVVAKTLDNTFIGSRIEQMRDGIERGESITRCATATGIFTPVALQMIEVGDEAGALGDLLIEIAGMYERETEYSIKNLSAAIEPILIMLIGGLVLLLALGVYLPIWNLSDAIMGRD
jgi:MSHA biogenesis protein MshG